jgi:hypothetical protein
MNSNNNSNKKGVVLLKPREYEIHDKRELENEIQRIVILFQEKENEHNWAKRDVALQKLQAWMHHDIFSTNTIDNTSM